MRKKSKVGQTRKDKSRKTVEVVIENGLCIGCGACVVVCPKLAIEIHLPHPDGNNIPLIEEGKCTDCGICQQVCPFFDVDHEQSLKDIYGDVPTIPALGHYLDLVAAFSQNPTIRAASASGGLVKEILLQAFHTDRIDGVVMAAPNDKAPLHPTGRLLRSEEDIMQPIGSYYGPVPVNLALRQAFSNPGRFAFVGLPCQILSARRASKLMRNKKGALVLYLSLVCGRGADYGLINLVLERNGIAPRDVLSFSQRVEEKMQKSTHCSKNQTVAWGKSPDHFFDILVSTKAKSTIRIPGSEFLSLWKCGYYTSRACYSCTDLSGYYADFGLGDVWAKKYLGSPIHYSLVITRSKLASRILNELMTSKKIQIETLDPANLLNESLYSPSRWKQASRRKRKHIKANGTVGIYRSNIAHQSLWAILALSFQDKLKKFADITGRLKIGRMFLLHVPGSVLEIIAKGFILVGLLGSPKRMLAEFKYRLGKI